MTDLEQILVKETCEAYRKELRRMSAYDPFGVYMRGIIVIMDYFSVVNYAAEIKDSKGFIEFTFEGRHTRTEAEQAAFTRAFEIREEQLKTKIWT
jgi:hypothetical protein